MQSAISVPELSMGETRIGKQVRILVVDDFEPFRCFVSSMLQKRPGLQVIDHVRDGLEAVRKAEDLQPDLILLDIGLPSLNGIEAARRIGCVSPRSKILFLSAYDSAGVAREALGTGAQGYLIKADAGGELLPAVEAVLLGKRFVSKRIEAAVGLGQRCS